MRQRVEHEAERAIGNVLAAVLAVAVMVELVRGESVSPYAPLLLVAGVVWVIGLASVSSASAWWRSSAERAVRFGRVAAGEGMAASALRSAGVGARS